jgi:hypothetical protein
MLSHAKIFDTLQAKMKDLNDTLWEDRAKWPHVEKWLRQFRSHKDVAKDEQIQMLFLASHFMYFGLREIRTLIRSLFRDVYEYKIIEEIRRKNNDTLDRAFIAEEFGKRLNATRFLGVGNPSESGSHLLYYFRQENGLGKQFFINTHEIFTRVGMMRFFLTRVKEPSIERYVFIDDLCGSGSQAAAYSKSIVEPLKRLNPKAQVCYYTLFATSFGLSEIKKLKRFDDVATVVELDESFKCFSDKSRIYKNEQAPFDRIKARAICQIYGANLEPGFPLGWRDGQLLIGFCHNTPDNTLPVIWYDDAPNPWTPLFRRFPKQYGWES